MVQSSSAGSRQFTFRGKRLFYNRIPYNNRAERIVEIPLAFDFLASRDNKDNMLEVGNALQFYENSLSDVLNIRGRHIIDKFEAGDGIEQIDLMDLNPERKYTTIVSISTVEHVGQSCAPTGRYGEQSQECDREAPLKAIAKIYDLLEIGGKAFLTVPFGKLTDGGWQIQFSSEYLELLVTSYCIPREAMTVNYMKQLAREPERSNAYPQWVEASAEELSDVRYDVLRGGARAVAVIELTKLPQPFTLNLDVPPTPLVYESSPLVKNLIFMIGWFNAKVSAITGKI
jgi:hypothetical protein